MLSSAGVRLCLWSTIISLHLVVTYFPPHTSRTRTAGQMSEKTVGKYSQLWSVGTWRNLCSVGMQGVGASQQASSGSPVVTSPQAGVLGCAPQDSGFPTLCSQLISEISAVLGGSVRQCLCSAGEGQDNLVRQCSLWGHFRPPGHSLLHDSWETMEWNVTSLTSVNWVVWSLAKWVSLDQWPVPATMCQIDVNIVKSVCSSNNNFTASCYLEQMKFILRLQQFLNGRLLLSFLLWSWNK